MKFGSLSKYFPPPRFLKPSHIGISFSDSSIKAIYFDKTSNEPGLKGVNVPLEKGSIVGGSIINTEDVVNKLSIIKKEFDLPFVFFTVPDELAYIFSASTIVGLSGNATESVAFIIEENVPLSLSDTVFDFVPMGVKKSDLEYKTDLVVTASVKKEVAKFSEALRKVDFEPVGCIHESQAIANAVISKKSPGVSHIIHARENMVGIYLVRNNVTYFSTLRPIFGKDYSEQFLDEYDKFLDYCSEQDVSKNQTVENIFVCGEFEYAKQIVEALAASPKKFKNIKLSNVWANVFEIDKHLPEIPYEKSLGFAGPIGAVLSDII